MTRLALIPLVALAIALGATAAVAAGPGAEALPPGAVAVVEGVDPPELGVVTVSEFRRSLAQEAAQEDVSPAPKPGDRRYRELAERALLSLLDIVWIQGEAAERGLSVTQREISKELTAIKRENFKSKAEYRRFLHEAKFTEAEVRERVGLQILATRIQRSVLRGVRGKEAASTAFTEFVADYNRRWRSRTICAERYATDRCSNGPSPRA